MSFSKISILLGAIWCLFCLVICLLGGATALLCTSPEIPQCGLSGVEAGRQWSKVVWWSISIFAAGTYFGFRAVWPELRVLARTALLAIKAKRGPRA